MFLIGLNFRALVSVARFRLIKCDTEGFLKGEFLIFGNPFTSACAGVGGACNLPIARLRDFTEDEVPIVAVCLQKFKAEKSFRKKLKVEISLCEGFCSKITRFSIYR